MTTQAQHVFEIKIGDWSGDGHGKHDAFRVSSNKPVRDAREAYFAAKEKLPAHLCPEDFLNNYQDGSLPEETWRDAKALGFDFLAGFASRLTDENLDEHLEYPQVETGKMCEYVLWFLKQGDPELEVSMLPPVDTLSFYGFDEKQRHIGYGLLGN